MTPQLAAEARLIARYGPGPGPAFAHFRRPAAMARHDRYALLTDVETPGAKPRPFPTLAALARRIHADRRGEPLQLLDARLMLQGDAAPGRAGVAVYADTGESRRFIGWAYLGGGDRLALQAALFAAQPRVGEMA